MQQIVLPQRRYDFGGLLALLKLLEMREENKSRQALRSEQAKESLAKQKKEEQAAAEKRFGAMAQGVLGGNLEKEPGYAPYAAEGKAAFENLGKLAPALKSLVGGELGPKPPGSDLPSGPALTMLPKPVSTEADVVNALARGRDRLTQDTLAQLRARFSPMEGFEKDPVYHSAVQGVISGEPIPPGKLEPYVKGVQETYDRSEKLKGDQQKRSFEAETQPKKMRKLEAEATQEEQKAAIGAAPGVKDALITKIINDATASGYDVEVKRVQAMHAESNAQLEQRIKTAEAALKEADVSRQPLVKERLELDIRSTRNQIREQNYKWGQHTASAALGNAWIEAQKRGDVEAMRQIENNLLVINDNYTGLAERSDKDRNHASGLTLDAVKGALGLMERMKTAKADQVGALQMEADFVNSRNANARFIMRADPKGLMDVYSVGNIAGANPFSSGTPTLRIIRKPYGEVQKVLDGSASRLFTAPIVGADGSPEQQTEIAKKAMALASEISIRHGYLGSDERSYRAIIDNYKVDPRVKVATNALLNKALQSGPVEKSASEGGRMRPTPGIGAPEPRDLTEILEGRQSAAPLGPPTPLSAPARKATESATGAAGASLRPRKKDDDEDRGY